MYASYTGCRGAHCRQGDETVHVGRHLRHGGVLASSQNQASVKSTCRSAAVAGAFVAFCFWREGAGCVVRYVPRGCACVEVRCGDAGECRLVPGQNGCLELGFDSLATYNAYCVYKYSRDDYRGRSCQRCCFKCARERALHNAPDTSMATCVQLFAHNAL